MSKNTFRILLFAILGVNFLGLFNEIFLADSSLYAFISKTFVTSGNYLDIVINGGDWLDKPHFPFWLCAASMEVFGINAFAYKLPSFLLFLVALGYTYQFAKENYSIDKARLSVLILGSSLHIVISNNDVRAEAILMGLLMGAVYHLYRLRLSFSWSQLLAGSLFSAAAVMTKGVFVLIPIFSAVLAIHAFRWELKKLFHWKWVLVLALVALFITPELYALYTQFDLHPEKTVFGKQGVSGIQFFLWDSQFGRFFNSGPIKGKGDLFFFLHTLLWAFAPWAVVGYLALFRSIKSIVQRKQLAEYFSLTGFLLMFLIFSVSKFQLPHYTNIIFPFLAILTAAHIEDLFNRHKWLTGLQFVLVGSLFILPFVIHFFYQPEGHIGLVMASLMAGSIWFSIRKSEIGRAKKAISFSFIGTVFIGAYLNLVFYPDLLNYQAGKKAAETINSKYPDDKIASNAFLHDWTFEFYLNTEIEHLYQGDIAELPARTLCYIDAKGLTELTHIGRPFEVLETFTHYHITRLNGTFLNAKTRDKKLGEKMLIRLLKPETPDNF